MFENSPSLSITPSTKAYVSSLIDFPSPIIKSPKKILANESILQRKLQNLRRVLKRKRAIISFLKNKNKKFENSKNCIKNIFNITKFTSKSSKILTGMQILHKKRRPWSKAEKQLALTLYYKSLSSYKYMRKNGIILPGESTVRRMLQSIAYVPGFLPEYSEQLVLKIKAMSEVEKKCVVLFDEMAIMKCIEYNKSLDMIEGFEDKGPLGRSSKYAKHVLVIMVRGLYTNWKFPLCYFLTCNGITGNELNIIIKSCIKKILDIGLLPTALVCDQGTQNRKLFSLLGGTENCPKTEIYGQTLFLIYDIPHLFKSIRNNLLNGNIKINEKTIVFQDIVKTYDIDRRSATARAMCKITPAHLIKWLASLHYRFLATVLRPL
jgi:hypothetical protein